MSSFEYFDVDPKDIFLHEGMDCNFVVFFFEGLSNVDLFRQTERSLKEIWFHVLIRQLTIY